MLLTYKRCQYVIYLNIHVYVKHVQTLEISLAKYMFFPLSYLRGETNPVKVLPHCRIPVIYVFLGPRLGPIYCTIIECITC